MDIGVFVPLSTYRVDVGVMARIAEEFGFESTAPEWAAEAQRAIGGLGERESIGTLEQRDCAY